MGSPPPLAPGAEALIDRRKEHPYRRAMITSKLTSKAAQAARLGRISADLRRKVIALIGHLLQEP